MVKCKHKNTITLSGQLSGALLRAFEVFEHPKWCVDCGSLWNRYWTRGRFSIRAKWIKPTWLGSV